MSDDLVRILDCHLAHLFAVFREDHDAIGLAVGNIYIVLESQPTK